MLKCPICPCLSGHNHVVVVHPSTWIEGLVITAVDGDNGCWHQWLLEEYNKQTLKYCPILSIVFNLITTIKTQNHITCK